MGIGIGIGFVGLIIIGMIALVLILSFTSKKDNGNNKKDDDSSSLLWIEGYLNEFRNC